VIEPNQFRTFPCPTYPEIRLAWFPSRHLAKQLREFGPDCIHIATEGTLGMAARSWCVRNRFPFTTSYHTQFPEYVRARAPIPLALSYAHLRRFHAAAARTMVATPTLQKQLETRAFAHRALDARRRRRAVQARSEGVSRSAAADLRVHGSCRGREEHRSLPRARLARHEARHRRRPRASLARGRVPRTRFVGYKFGAELAAHLAATDVFVFPSRTDTFGLVLLEALACGVPVAAYPVTGPIDVIENGVTGVLDEDLRAAALAALQMDPAKCRAFALAHTWEAATKQFLGNLAPREAEADVRLKPDPQQAR
jgi:hypothetical protein